MVTFLFTDIEGSTRRWEIDPDGMRSALTEHDSVLRAIIASHGGWVFKHTGDGVCAAFGGAGLAVTAAVEAQRALRMPVRMGIAAGQVERRDGDYFGAALNRTARVMGAGHGGQVLVAGSASAIMGEVAGVVLGDLGQHRLRDLSEALQLFQVHADGLPSEFPPLRTLNSVPGNLVSQASSFVGREVEVAALKGAVRAHRLVTLTGVGGVGKTRLALQIAGELSLEFPDGVWLVELAHVSDPGAVADVVGAVFRVASRSDLSMVACVADSLAGRRMLLVLDNCEHVLDAAAELVGAVLSRSESITVLTTSREGLRVDGEHLWPVPSLGVGQDVRSDAVSLFVERARALVPSFGLDDDLDAAAVGEICRRLDGIALAVELAAARMVSMTPIEVRDRLDDRFRLLGGSRRGLERHQTLRQAVQWSFDLLRDDERAVLDRCSVFAGGFGLAAAVAVCGWDASDEYAMLDVLDSLVRKSLLTTQRSRGGSRYAVLETIRQYAEARLGDSGTMAEVRTRHALHFASEADVHYTLFISPAQSVANSWLEAELPNLRVAFRWAVEQPDLQDTASNIAANASLIGGGQGIVEPIAWAEEMLPIARSQKLFRLRQLYVGAANCASQGRAEEAVDYVTASLALSEDPQYLPVAPALEYFVLAAAHFYAGRPDDLLDVAAEGIRRSGDPSGFLRALVVWTLASVGRGEEARLLAHEAVSATESSGVPGPRTLALYAYGRAYADTDPASAFSAFRRALTIARENNSPGQEAVSLKELACAEARYGDPLTAFDAFEQTITLFHQSGATSNLASTIAELVVFFDRLGQHQSAATLYGFTTRDVAAVTFVPDLPTAANHLNSILGPTTFEHFVAEGSGMEWGQAVRYATSKIGEERAKLSKA